MRDKNMQHYRGICGKCRLKIPAYYHLISKQNVCKECYGIGCFILYVRFPDAVLSEYANWWDNLRFETNIPSYVYYVHGAVSDGAVRDYISNRTCDFYSASEIDDYDNYVLWEHGGETVKIRCFGITHISVSDRYSKLASFRHVLMREYERYLSLLKRFDIKDPALNIPFEKYMYNFKNVEEYIDRSFAYFVQHYREFE